MDISALENMNIDVLIAILVFFALLSFVLFSIFIRLSRSIDGLKDALEEKCKNCKVLKTLENRPLKKDNGNGNEVEQDPIRELERLQMGI